MDAVGNQEACPPACIEGDECAWPVVSDAQTGVVPWSRVDDLPPNTGSRTFIVSWSGSDDVQVYDVQVRDGRYGTWQIWQRGVAYTSAPYTGEYSHVYGKKPASDTVGNHAELLPQGQRQLSR